MAKREVFDCERCGKPACDTYTVRVFIGTTYNGTDRVSDYKEMDLCAGCCAALLRSTFSANDAKANKELLKQLDLVGVGLFI